MFAIDDATAVAVMPTPEAAGTPGFFTEGNPALGQAATYVRASFLNSLMQELLNLLAGAGIAPSKTAYDQLLTGLRSNALVTGNATGAANTYAVAYTPAIAALTDGMVLWFKASASNTGASTLNINAVGVKPIVGGAHLALQGGEILANGRCLVVWNAALNSWVLIECTGAALQVGAATQSQHAMQLGQATGRLLRKLVYMRIAGVQNVSINGGAFTTTGAGTYVPGSTMSFCIAKVMGASGAAGGPTLPTAGNVSLGSPGTAGAYAESLFTAVQIGASQVVTVGLGGTKVVGGAGNSGGASSLGSLLSCQGGPGGGALNNQAPPTTAGNSNVATSTGANLFKVDGLGGYPSIATSAAASGNIGGQGGGSPFGAGPAGGTNSAGTDARNFGSGGAGTVINNGFGGNTAGGAGFDGIVIIEEYA